ncbi:MAG: hypothetical protein M3Z24_15590, partial [Chloroflexota bacterium]|nr:hypothetical protein [Chloroflexota bacterium]
MSRTELAYKRTNGWYQRRTKKEMSNQPYPPDPNQPNQQPTYQDNQVPADPASNAARSANSGNAYAQSQYQSYVDPAGN